MKLGLFLYMLAGLIVKYLHWGENNSHSNYTHMAVCELLSSSIYIKCHNVP